MQQNSKLRVVIKRVNEPPVEAEIPNTYETLRDIVGGYIESVVIGSNVHFWCNEEGKLRNLPPNFILQTDCGSETIVGDVVFCGFDDEGNEVSLTDVEVAAIMASFSFGPVPVEEVD